MEIQYLNSNEFLYKTSLTYVIFPAIWNGRYYLTAIDYDRYAIPKLCSEETNQSKYKPCVSFTKHDKELY
jgi:hypothetical protein